MSRPQTIPTFSAPEFDITVERNLAMRTHDGVTLRADAYRPRATGKFPVVLIRTPYGKTTSLNVGGDYGDYFARRGYVVVIQDTRGRAASEGEFYFVAHEAIDGYETVEWAATLPWSSGHVGTAGQSYYACTQVLLATTSPKHLKAIIPISAPSDFHESYVYRTGGAFQLAWQMSRILGPGMEAARRKGKSPGYFRWIEGFAGDTPGSIAERWYRHVPTSDWGKWFEDIMPYVRDHMGNPDAGPVWWQTSIAKHYPLISAAGLHITSWYDAVLEGSIQNYRGIKAHGRTPLARRSQKLFIGPWGHLTPYTKPTTGGAGDIDFGPAAAVDIHGLELRWFDYWLKGLDSGIMRDPPVRVFVMGENVWRHEADWPLPGTRYESFYLHSAGHANTLDGDGALSTVPPANELPDDYVYDPEDPVPTCGGPIFSLPFGVRDQRPVERRPDVLVYSSAPLERDTEVTGPVTVELFAASSAPDTDFTAKLVDVHPDGFARNLCDGIIRARYRESRVTPTLIEPGKVYRYGIDLWGTSNVFKKGHRVRLELSSSNFPWFDRNPNTGAYIPAETKLVAARQTVLHDAQHPSHIRLPVIER